MGKGGCGWQPPAPGTALPLLSEASPASHTPVRRKGLSGAVAWVRLSSAPGQARLGHEDQL